MTAPGAELAATDEVGEPGGTSLACRVRVLTMVALGPLVTGYAAVAAVLALVTSIASKARFTTTGVLTSAAPGWLAAHQVPVRIGGHVLGALPLLPTIVAVVLIARTAAGAVHRLDLHTPRQAAQVVAAVVGGHAVFGVALGLWCAGGPAEVDPLAAFWCPALLAAVGSVAGVARYSGLLDLVAERVDAVAVRGLRAGVFAVVALLATGALVVTLGLVTSVPTVRELFARNAPGPGSGLGLLLLCAGYLPNAVIAGASFVAGPGFSMGTISVAPLHFSGGPVPGLPLLAALPERTAEWWPILLVLPVGVGVLVGRLLRDAAEEPLARLRAVAVATGVVALTLVILAGCAGGPLGGGRYDPVDLHAASLSVALVAWIGITATAVAWFGGTRWAPAEDPPHPAATFMINDNPGVEAGEPEEEGEGGEEEEARGEGIGGEAEPVDQEQEPAGDEDLAAEID
jgi:Family of unknown function (DUF6350)